MKRILILLIGMAVFSCGSFNKPSKKTKEYFEGVITYSIDYIPKSKKYSAGSLKEFIGTKMVLTFKQGNYIKQYYATSGKLLSERFLNLEENRSYNRVAENDTTYWVNITKADTKTTFKRIRNC